MCIRDRPAILVSATSMKLWSAVVGLKLCASRRTGMSSTRTTQKFSTVDFGPAPSVRTNFQNNQTFSPVICRPIFVVSSLTRSTHQRYPGGVELSIWNAWYSIFNSHPWMQTVCFAKIQTPVSIRPPQIDRDTQIWDLGDWANAYYSVLKVILICQ